MLSLELLLLLIILFILISLIGVSLLAARIDELQQFDQHKE